MKTLIVYFSKTGNTRAVADKVGSALGCGCDELQFDMQAHTISGAEHNPADYDTVMLMCPIWAFHLPEPMELYLRQYGNKIRRYKLAVTYQLFGLRGCVNGCKKLIGKAPETAVKIKAKDIKNGTYDISSITDGEK